MSDYFTHIRRGRGAQNEVILPEALFYFHDSAGKSETSHSVRDRGRLTWTDASDDNLGALFGEEVSQMTRIVTEDHTRQKEQV